MKDIKRYFFINGVEHESNDGRWARFDECEVLVSARDHIINELEHRIKELENEKELAYQQGKNDICDIFKAFISGDTATKIAIMEKVKN